MSTFAQITNDWMELSSGARFYLDAPDPATITVEVIAHHLAQVNRYGGAARRPYSVAEHAVLVARRLRALGYDAATCLAGLHHDDAEAFVGDVVRPIKRSLGGYAAIEARVQAACEVALGVAPGVAAAVDAADDWALSCEAAHLMPSGGAEWVSAGLYDGTGRLRPARRCSWRRARLRYLRMHRELTMHPGERT